MAVSRGAAPTWLTASLLIVAAAACARGKASAPTSQALSPTPQAPPSTSQTRPSTSQAEPNAPGNRGRSCAVALFVEGASLDATGRVTGIRPPKAGGSGLELWSQVSLRTDDGRELAFNLLNLPDILPFTTGDLLEVSIRRGGGWHRVYDGVIRRNGQLLVIASGSGSVDLAKGWKIQPGKVVKSDGGPGSLRRTHALDVSMGQWQATVPPDGCTEIAADTGKWLVAGFAVAWEGLRPPEGVDYQTFSIVRAR